MAYIWINPVTASMYETEELNHFLLQNGFQRMDVSIDWMKIVKEKYRTAVENADCTVIDVRCPKIRELYEEMQVTSKVILPKINPILIHCGQELCEREEYGEERKIITTPCQALADMGNALKLKNTWFVPWIKFLESLERTSKGGKLEGTLPKESPIPLGFFDELGFYTESYSGEEEIREYFASPVPKDVQLVELLYCKNGCHNGDGIVGA